MQATFRAREQENLLARCVIPPRDREHSAVEGADHRKRSSGGEWVLGGRDGMVRFRLFQRRVESSPPRPFFRLDLFGSFFKAVGFRFHS